MHPAELMNELGGVCPDRGHLACARLAYAGASVLAPGSSVPWFNRGLVAKHQRRWEDSRAFNRRAAALAPNEGLLLFPWAVMSDQAMSGRDRRGRA